jgi:hypothetical protein
LEDELKTYNYNDGRERIIWFLEGGNNESNKERNVRRNSFRERIGGSGKVLNVSL